MEREQHFYAVLNRLLVDDIEVTKHAFEEMADEWLRIQDILPKIKGAEVLECYETRVVSQFERAAISSKLPPKCRVAARKHSEAFQGIALFNA